MGKPKPPTTRVGKEIKRLLEKRGMTISSVTVGGKTPKGGVLQASQLSRIIHGYWPLSPDKAVIIANAIYTSPRVLMHLWVEDVMDKMGVPPDAKP